MRREPGRAAIPEFLRRSLSNEALEKLFGLPLEDGPGTDGEEEEAPVGPEQALHRAVEAGDVPTVTAMLDGGLDVNHCDVDGWTPIFWTAYKGSVEMAQFLLSRGARLDLRARNGETPLHLAAAYNAAALVRLLVEQGLDVNARTDAGLTPLHLAASMGHADAVRALIECCADLRFRTASGRTPLDLARSKGHQAVVHLFHQFGAVV
jgi:ankyrin repeat protein